MIKYFLFFSLLVAGCSPTIKKNSTSEIVAGDNASEKIVQVEVTTLGGRQGSYSYFKITRDSIIIHFSLAIDSTQNYSINKTNNTADWEGFRNQINLDDFKKASDGESMLPVDGADTEIKIKTNKGETAKVNANPNETWNYIYEFCAKYFNRE